MENGEEDDDVKLVRASTSLLQDLENSLPRLLWRPSPSPSSPHGKVHRRVKRRDLVNLINLIEPFQSEPQLLDAHLKRVVPAIVEAYLESLLGAAPSPSQEHLTLQSGACQLLYTLCKVRGYKIIVGFLSNEPRYLEPILAALENTLSDSTAAHEAWQVQYILLLWLSHLLLTPFDLESISATTSKLELPNGLEIAENVPSIVHRILRVGQHYLPASTKAQEAAAAMLVRLVIRPDMQKLSLADVIVRKQLSYIGNTPINADLTIYERLGPLRFLAGIAASADLNHLIPSVYRACQKLAEEQLQGNALSNAVAKKAVVKILRNIAILSLRTANPEGPFLSFLETTGVLEDVIDHLLQSLGDRDTPVRYAAAKAISLIILELDPEMGHDVIQAVLDTFKEDMPRHQDELDFRTVNALKWHGLTLTLGHALFKRTTSPSQLPDILNSLYSALQFEQRTATGSSLGANVRDAANFGIWSLARRYTTAELQQVPRETLRFVPDTSTPVIQAVAIQLILSACLDPAGNIRRGSSAALQELIGRHPDQVHEGIALVQIVDYQAVGLRRRAMVDVAHSAAGLLEQYREALLNGVLGWRGVGSQDVSSRDAAAASIAALAISGGDTTYEVALLKVVSMVLECATAESEVLHGLIGSLALLVEGWDPTSHKDLASMVSKVEAILQKLLVASKDFSARNQRSELPSATALLLTALCKNSSFIASGELWGAINVLILPILDRHEPGVWAVVSQFVLSVFQAKMKAGTPLGDLEASQLQRTVSSAGHNTMRHGAGRALALGTLLPLYGSALSGEVAISSVRILTDLSASHDVDWRTIGIKAIQLAVENAPPTTNVDRSIVQLICQALERGMNDYTIDERGDVGSLVRLQAISCTGVVFESNAIAQDDSSLDVLRSNIYRLSLEKLDRVRLQAAQCRERFLDLQCHIADVTAVSSLGYFEHALHPLLQQDVSPHFQKALLEGCVSCAGVGAESLLQAARRTLADILWHLDSVRLLGVMGIFADILKKTLDTTSNTQPALELLVFLLEMQIPQRLTTSDFKWRNLLSTVQKAHHKSNDIPKILAAVRVYYGLADVPAINHEVMKKLIAMLKTNPYPRVRTSVAEVLLDITDEARLKLRDWAKPPASNNDIVDSLKERFVDV